MDLAKLVQSHVCNPLDVCKSLPRLFKVSNVENEYTSILIRQPFSFDSIPSLQGRAPLAQWLFPALVKFQGWGFDSLPPQILRIWSKVGSSGNTSTGRIGFKILKGTEVEKSRSLFDFLFLVKP